MIIEFTSARPPVRRRRWLRGMAVLSVLVAGLVGAAASSSALASTAVPSDRYAVCLPSTPCMPVVEAMVAGTMAWDANTNIYRAANTARPLVTVWFTEIDGAAETNLPPIRVLRGNPVTDTMRISSSADALRVSLCDGASLRPTPDCRSTVVVRVR